MAVQYDGELHLWWLDDAKDPISSCAHGAIFNDRKNRFDDGTEVRTSAIVSRDGETLHTRNSVYRLVPRDETMRMITAGIAAHRTDAAKVA